MTISVLEKPIAKLTPTQFQRAVSTSIKALEGTAALPKEVIANFNANFRQNADATKTH